MASEVSSSPSRNQLLCYLRNHLLAKLVITDSQNFDFVTSQRSIQGYITGQPFRGKLCSQKSLNPNARRKEKAKEKERNKELYIKDTN
jgi:hypothetical protein